VLLACVVLYDVSQSWSLIDDWAGLQGYYDGLPLPNWIEFSDETILRLIFGIYAACTFGLLFGYRTEWCTLAVWLISSGHQYAASNTLDYHDAVIVNLLLWSLALPLGQRFSVDAALAVNANGVRRTPAQVVAGCGFVLTLAWLYLDTAAFKDGAAWWSEGSAVRFALMDFSARSPTGVWALAHLPEAFFRTATHAVMAVEWVIPLLLLSPWKRSLLRTVGVLALAGMHGAMWLLMDIGSFPPTMVAAATALLPAAFWNQVARRMTGCKAPAVIEQTEEGSQGARSLACRGRVQQYLLIAFFGLCTVINIEGNRLRALNTDLRMPYPGATWVLKLKYLLGVENSWAMYAPEPARYGGWWVALGQRQDGSVIDLITGEGPTLEAPFPRKGAHHGLRGHYWSQAPYQDGPQHTYLRFLLWRNQTAPEVDHIVDLQLLYVYECYEPASMSGSSHRRYPLSVLTWPAADKTNGAPAAAGADRGRGTSEAWVLYRAELDRLGTPDWRPARLEPDRSSP
jgi:hypothetical protein